MSIAASRAAILTLLAACLVATRLHHFAAVPDASWAVFFVGGFYLARWTRWAFPLLMLLAVLVDWAVIRGTGVDFWSHYCVSPGYWALLPAHFALWAGGWWLQRRPGSAWRKLAWLVPTLALSVALCHLFAQGGFYWLSDAVSEPTLAGWWKNYTDWLWPYLRVTAMYVAIAALAHALMTMLVPAQGDADHRLSH